MDDLLPRADLGLDNILATLRDLSNTGQATAGVICSVIALIIAVDLSVHVGTWVARNKGVFTRFDKCIAQAGNRTEVSTCFAHFATIV